MTICRVGYLTFYLFVASELYALGLYWLCEVADVGECIFVHCYLSKRDVISACLSTLNMPGEVFGNQSWLNISENDFCIGSEFSC